MSDAMLRKMQYKQHTQVNQTNMEQQRVLIDKLKRIQTNSKKAQKRVKGGSPVKTLGKQPKGSQEIDIQIQGESQDIINYRTQNNDDRHTETSVPPDSWQENAGHDD